MSIIKGNSVLYIFIGNLFPSSHFFCLPVIEAERIDIRNIAVENTKQKRNE